MITKCSMLVLQRALLIMARVFSRVFLMGITRTLNLRVPWNLQESQRYPGFIPLVCKWESLVSPWDSQF